MGGLDDAIAREQTQRRRDSQVAAAIIPLTDVFGSSLMLTGYGGFALPSSGVPASHKDLFDEALDRARAVPHLWSHVAYLFGSHVAGHLVPVQSGDVRARRAGRRVARAWKRYKKTHQPVACWRIHMSGADYNSVDVYVAPDGRTWAPSYDGGWESVDRFASAVAKSFV